MGKIIFERTTEDTCLVRIEGKVPEKVLERVRREMISPMEISLKKAVEFFNEADLWKKVRVEMK
jgi:hypothetical protein